ncbi:uncharacterized protein TM35_000043040 [Trypanosoma theileri]|uniref:RING-type domain-containing protein n=1 Tax=Trypanosoma theileri TaxID=67003 RepID=A0A1X0P6N3_9TRYP|nr:uncharacterized protein TM35_000043040 [Trypanosoma theileri]ORC92090.1 hypothetical protein TM35_000043040 [Trypanosoma theileri]
MCKDKKSRDEAKKDDSNTQALDTLVSLIGVGVVAAVGVVVGGFVGYVWGSSCSDDGPNGNNEANKFQELKEEEYKSMGSEGKCSVCMERNARVLFLPCKHLATCTTCAERLDRRCCPMCNQPYAEKINVFTT